MLITSTTGQRCSESLYDPKSGCAIDSRGEESGNYTESDFESFKEYRKAGDRLLRLAWKVKVQSLTPGENESQQGLYSLTPWTVHYELEKKDAHMCWVNLLPNQAPIVDRFFAAHHIRVVYRNRHQIRGRSYQRAELLLEGRALTPEDWQELVINLKLELQGSRSASLTVTSDG